MAVSFIRRRFKGHFGISAPKMTVTTSRPWWERGAVIVAFAGLVGGAVWWAFDFGQLFAHVNRREIDARYAAMEIETGRLRSDASALRVQNSQLQSDLAMSRGAEQALARQLAELAAENAELKEAAMALKRAGPDTDRQIAARRVR